MVDHGAGAIPSHRGNRSVMLFARKIVDRMRDGTEPIVYFPGTSEGRRTAWVFSYTGVSNEPRVIRQMAALGGAGWRTVVFGYDGHSDRPPEWHYARLPSSSAARFALHKSVLLSIARRVGLRLAAAPLPRRIRGWGARLYHACVPRYRYNRRALRQFREDHPSLKPDLVISNDFFTADLGHDAARWAGAKFIIDCHEYARGQYMHDPQWVKRVRPYVIGFQDYVLARADAVTTVSAGIAELLDREQALRRPVQVVRSLPFRSAQPFRPTGDRITVLYLGDISYIRGLHKAIKSLPMWRSEFQLVLRGPADPTYVAELQRLAQTLGVADRLRIEPPVPFDRIVPSANQADIGYFVHKALSPQKRFVLPNKFFEYVMAGLALCVSDLPEMERLVRQYGFGKLVPDYDETVIAEVVNSFDRETIDAMKRRSLEAAQELNWEVEQQRMLSLCESLA